MTTQRLLTAKSPRQMYEEALNRLLRQAGNLDARAVRQALSLLAEARRHILDVLSQLPAESFLANFLPRLQREVEAAIRDYGRKYGTLLDEQARLTWNLGMALVDEPLASAGVNIIVRLPSIDPGLIDVLSGFRASMITGLEDYAIHKITTEIQLTLLGGRSPYELQRNIATLLRTTPDASGAFHNVAARAETIARTEVNRVLNLSTLSRQSHLQQRLKSIRADVIVRKRWLNSADTRVRPAHRRESLLEQRPVLEGTFTYLASNGQTYEVLGPYDPQLPAADSINCRCRSIVAVDSIEALLTEAA